MPYDPNRDPKPFPTDEKARNAALDFIRGLGKIIGFLIPFRRRSIRNDQGEIIGTEYEGTKGKVSIRRDTHPTADEKALGITTTWDVRAKGQNTVHFASTQRRRKRK